MPKKKRSKSGVPALLYAEPSEIDEPLLGSLSIKQSSSSNHISLLVTASISLPGSDKKQNFVLGYDADNLVPGTTALAANADSCNTASLEKIARDGLPRMHTLSLTLKSACSIWYMRQALPTTCPQLVEIAKAFKVHLIIDFSWLQQRYQSCIRRLVNKTTGLYGFPVGETLAQFERGDWTIFQPLRATNEPLNELPAYFEILNKRSGCTHAAISPSSSPPPPKRAIFTSEALGFLPQSPTEVDTSPSRSITSPPSERAILELEAFGFPAQSLTEVATSPSCDTTIDESSSRSVLDEPSFGTSAFPDRQDVAISGAVAHQIPHAFEASPRHFFPTLEYRLLFTTPPSAARLHRLKHERADHEFRDHLDDAKEEAQWNIIVAKDEGIESLNDTRDAVLHEVADKLLTQTDDFEKYLDTIVRDIIGKADEEAAAIIRKADEKAAAMMSKADEKMRDAATMMSRVEKMAKAATASLWDTATKASGDRDANSRRPFSRGKGGYRGLRSRSFRHRIEH
ncbi:hypothetical protein DDE82_009039 [Stemphylium lycopersici]|uniref:Uncharacterized protein n=1 Tax=Stemphylium lycopersici TaxID=183478 RepID=A0A364MS29_STELY|nr:hypothetical protein TW65_09324 [Stemphylium lycopersici]RAQ98654.1 hypothetical protein DDE82_009039 [Stemphylium lycopersici]RAR00779.1 hypothetical protein DDE83_009053 [Stemphylium lycopersici]